MNTKNKILTNSPTSFPAHLVQTNKAGTLARLPSVLGLDKGTLVKVPTGETLIVGDVLMRDKGRDKRELLLTSKTGGLPVSPINMGGNVFRA